MPPSPDKIRRVIGLELTHPKTYDSCGIIAPFYGNPLQHQVVARGFLPFAGDAYGNAFVQSVDGGIHFWDHETDEISEIAENWDEFESWCHEPQDESNERP